MGRPASLVVVISLLLLVACEDEGPPVDVDAGGSLDATVLDANVDAGPRWGACVVGEHADWYCVQGDPETHQCTDSMWPPRCTDGEWDCQAGAPDWHVGCWCRYGPPGPGVDHSLCTCTEAEGLDCDAPCGPTLRCDAYDDYCARTLAGVEGAPDTYECRACASHDCDCVGPGATSCERGVNGGITATYAAP